MSIEIQSPQNKHYRRWMSLHDSVGVKKYSQCLVSGYKIILELMEQLPELCLEGITSDRIQEPPPEPSYILPHHLFKKVDLFGTQTPLLIASVPEFKSFSKSKPPLGLEVLCGLGDPGNVGALARCCEAFRVSRLILLEGSVHPFHPKVIRSSSGSVFRLCIEKGLAMEEIDFDVVALDQRFGQSMESFSWPLDMRLLMGEEGRGVPKSLRATRLSLPMAPSMDSLNAVSASSIALYAYYRHHCIESLD